MVTCACSGAPSVYSGAGTDSMIVWNSGTRLSLSGMPPSVGCSSDARPALAEAKTTGKSSALSCAESSSRSRNSSYVSSTTSLMRASGRSTLLTTRMTGSFAASALRSTKRVWGSGPSEASTSSTTASTIDRPRSTSPPKSACPGVSMMLIVTPPSGAPGAVVAHGGVLGEDRDALLALEVAGVHGPLGELVVLVVGALLPQHRVDEGGLAVVDVGDDRDVAQVGAHRHG